MDILAVFGTTPPREAYADPSEPALPPTDMAVSRSDTAVVITDPQIDFLSPDGVTWAAAKLPEGDGYLAALTNFRFIANGLWTTDEAVRRIQRAKR